MRNKKPFHTNKLITNPFKPYTKQELELIINMLNVNKNLHVSEILSEILKINPNTKLSHTQIKKIRFVYLKGDDISKSQLWDFENDKSRLFVSRVKLQLNKRKKGLDNFDEYGNIIK